jgi:hypothetical protein
MLKTKGRLLMTFGVIFMFFGCVFCNSPWAYVLAFGSALFGGGMAIFTFGKVLQR